VAPAIRAFGLQIALPIPSARRLADDRLLRLLSQQLYRAALSSCEDKVINYTEPVLFAELAIVLWLIIMGAKEWRLAVAQP
jgi:hypothetical protein